MVKKENIQRMVDKRRSGNYKQICGHIPIVKYRKFKAACVERDIGQSEAIEQAIDLWCSQEFVPPNSEAQAIEPQTLHQLVSQNIAKLRRAGIKNLQAIANEEVLPTKTDFVKIAAALGLPESEQKRIWTQAFNSSSKSEEISNGHT